MYKYKNLTYVQTFEAAYLGKLSELINEWVDAMSAGEEAYSIKDVQIMSDAEYVHAVVTFEIIAKWEMDIVERDTKGDPQ